ncbi:TIGR02449 family protein [Arenimonas sp. GDDSR-1]|uniref:TIGR02449 family protein n=1 Tax=Arenimonas sp. GDDSR-1 TaxID=2950125 RepID=UPI0026250BC9|nr:TIGR02449 family protein [Arenimonas sp. GDDSR-1]
MSLFPDHARQIQDLAQRLDRLLEATARLSAENTGLKQQLELLTGERNALQGKNELVRTRVESMLGRLNDMERSDDP